MPAWYPNFFNYTENPRGNEVMSQVGVVTLMGADKLVDFSQNDTSGLFGGLYIGAAAAGGHGQVWTNYQGAGIRNATALSIFRTPDLQIIFSNWVSFEGYAISEFDIPSLAASTPVTIPHFIATARFRDPKDRINFGNLSSDAYYSAVFDGDVLINGVLRTGGVASTDPLSIIDASSFNRGHPEQAGGPSRGIASGWINGSTLVEQIAASVILPMGSKFTRVKFHLQESTVSVMGLALKSRSTTGVVTVLASTNTGLSGVVQHPTITAATVTIAAGGSVYVELNMDANVAQDFMFFSCEILP